MRRLIQVQRWFFDWSSSTWLKLEHLTASYRWSCAKAAFVAAFDDANYFESKVSGIPQEAGSAEYADDVEIQAESSRLEMLQVHCEGVVALYFDDIMEVDHVEDLPDGYLEDLTQNTEAFERIVEEMKHSISIWQRMIAIARTELIGVDESSALEMMLGDLSIGE